MIVTSAPEEKVALSLSPGYPLPPQFAGFFQFPSFPPPVQVYSAPKTLPTKHKNTRQRKTFFEKKIEMRFDFGKRLSFKNPPKKR